jgi:ribonuclease G
LANILLINARAYQTRVALLEDGLCVEYYTENPDSLNLAGNIYRGQVRRVLPGMQAAFVDIGLPKAAFLYVDDVGDPWSNTDVPPGPTVIPSAPAGADPAAPPSIEGLLRPGQDLMVQVAKEPLGEKGPRVTNYISLPSCHLVMMPLVSHVGVSRRIESLEERARLRALVTELRPSETGFIVRTAAENLSREKLEAEINFLHSMWQAVCRRWETARAPALIHRDLSVSLRSVRDLASQDIDRLIIDSPDEHRQVRDFVSTFMPDLMRQIELYDQPVPIFQAYGVDQALQNCRRRKVWLRSGGYIIFQHTEALTAVDVNTGRYVGKRNLEETMLNTNLEAVEEIARQLRLRNIGGLIVIDFIDMQQDESKEKVVKSLKEALSRDRSKTNVLDMSHLGLVEMTRKRVRAPWVVKEQQPCPYCNGEAMVRQPAEVCREIFRALEAEAGREAEKKQAEAERVLLKAHPEVHALLENEEKANLACLAAHLGLKVEIAANKSLHLEEFALEKGGRVRLWPIHGQSREGDDFMSGFMT